MIDRKELQQLAAEEEQLLKRLKKQLGKKSKDRLIIRTRGKNHYYSISRGKGPNRKETYLPKSNQKLLTDLCESIYLRKLIPQLEKEILALQTFLKDYQPEGKIRAIDAVPLPYRDYFPCYYKTNAEICREWEQEAYPRHHIPPEGRQYVTKKNEVVRSRIELIVANLLYDLGIPYRYECCLSVNGREIYPDFSIMHPETLEIYYLEIFGMMDLEEYAVSAFGKIAEYQKAGLAGKLIPFFHHDGQPLQTEAIEAALRSIFIE